jgi:glycosyltransferase involved in cell wall biosynthesis
VVHTHTAKAGALGRLAAVVYNATRPRRRRALVVHTFHGHVFEGYFSPRVNRLVQTTERALARITDRIVTISPRQREDIVTRFRIAPASKTIVVPLGLQLGALLSMPAAGAPDLRSAIGASADDLIVGYAGRMVPVKDMPTLLHAFARALATEPRLRLVMAGDGPGRDGVVQLANELGIKERLHFLGWVHDLPRFYATTDLFVLSSLNEGTPVAVIEAMAAARPVVATAVGGVPDVVETGVTGVLVAAGGVEPMAEGIVQLASDPGLRQRMGAAGRARAAARYSHLRLVSEVEEMYVEALRIVRSR